MTVVRKHDGCFAKMNVHKTIQYRDFKHSDEHMFLEQLTYVPWSVIDMTDDVEVKLDLFEQMYISVLNEHVPIIVKRVTTVKQPPWFNADLAKSIAARDRLFNCAKPSIDPRAMAMYRRARNRANHDIRKAKRELFLNSLERQSPNPRVIWNHIKSSLATTSAVQSRQTNQNRQTQPHAKMMVDKFNEHFRYDNINIWYNDNCR